MKTPAVYNELVSIVKTLSIDDCVWLMHLMHKEEMEYKYGERILNSDKDLLDNNISLLNSLHNISEVKTLTLNKYKDYDDHYIENLIESINHYIESTTFRSLDLLKYKTNKRFLTFTLYKLEQHLKNEELKIQEIRNIYLRFIYIISVFDNTDRFLDNLTRIEKTYSKIMLEKPLHFKNYDHIDFYRWVIQYLKDDRTLSRAFNLRDYHPIQDSDFKDTALSVFDKIYDEDINAYCVLKNKISNAWYQKAYRQKNKGKEHRYYFTDKAKESLKIMAAKEGLSEEKMLEKLINQHYATLYVNQKSGKDLYSLT